VNGHGHRAWRHRKLCASIFVPFRVSTIEKRSKSGKEFLFCARAMFLAQCGECACDNSLCKPPIEGSLGRVG
jgi:hypothetical protein